MWRLYFLVFGGEERSEAAKKAHESPLSMTMPLVMLSIGTLVIGFLGLPHLSPGLSAKLPKVVNDVGHGLSNWLAPSVSPTWFNPGGDLPKIAGHASDNTIFALMAGALAIGLLGIGLAWTFYGRGPTKTLEQLVTGPLAGAYTASKHKLWFDEVYDALIVRPFNLVARGMFEIADKFIIDTVAVNGSAFVVGLAGRVSRWVQNGQVQRYLTGLVIGAAAVFLISDCRREATVEYEIRGNEVTLRALPGSGIIAAHAKIQWDLDGDGAPDVDPANPSGMLEGAEIKVRAGDLPGSTVTAFIEDAVSRKRVRVTKRLQLDKPAPPETAAPPPATPPPPSAPMGGQP
jgi:NADH-quinone oxidoreductase subunit L